MLLQHLSLKKLINIFFISTLFFGCGDSSNSQQTSYKCDTIIDKKYYEICYSFQYKGAKFVSFELDGSKVNLLNIEEREDFYKESSLKPSQQSSNEDYIGSGYDRGHLASDASFDYSLASLHSVYSMANIIPQYPEINRYFWIKTEYYERQKAKEFGKVKVIIGVVYPENPLQLGENKISVPNGFYKMIQNSQHNFQACYFYENIPIYDKETDKLQDHQVQCDDLILNYY